jgi:hypothetical protein
MCDSRSGACLGATCAGPGVWPVHGPTPMYVVRGEFDRRAPINLRARPGSVVMSDEPVELIMVRPRRGSVDKDASGLHTAGTDRQRHGPTADGDAG